MIGWETADLGAYRSVVEALRETAFSAEYFDAVHIVPAIEDAYANHDRVPAIA